MAPVPRHGDQRRMARRMARPRLPSHRSPLCAGEISAHVAGQPRGGIVVRARPHQAEIGAFAVTDRIEPRIVFYDPVCPAPYTRATLEPRALGGSEASTVRVAEALDAVVMQHC